MFLTLKSVAAFFLSWGKSNISAAACSEYQLTDEIVFLNRMEKREKILVAPLDWGLGHATRCIPIIKLLLEKGADVILAADGRAAMLLKEEFPSLKHIHLQGYRIRYSKTIAMTWMIALQIPKIIFSII